MSPPRALRLRTGFGMFVPLRFPIRTPCHDAAPPHKPGADVIERLVGPMLLPRLRPIFASPSKFTSQISSRHLVALGRQRSHCREVPQVPRRTEASVSSCPCPSRRTSPSIRVTRLLIFPQPSLKNIRIGTTSGFLTHKRFRPQFRVALEIAPQKGKAERTGGSGQGQSFRHNRHPRAVAGSRPD